MIEKLVKDFPEQFKHGVNINAIANAIDKQIEEIIAVYEELRTKRNLSTAEGKQLDLLGSNIGLTRAEAMEIMGEEQCLDDELYRKLLKHKAYKNANNGTYYDLMQELALVLGEGTKIRYKEDPSEPATIILTANKGGIGQIPPSVPAGIGVVYESEIKHEIDFIPRFSSYEYTAPKCGTFRCGTRRI